MSNHEYLRRERMSNVVGERWNHYEARGVEVKGGKTYANAITQTQGSRNFSFQLFELRTMMETFQRFSPTPIIGGRGAPRWDELSHYSGRGALQQIVGRS